MVNTEQILDWMNRFNAKVQSKKEELTQLDTPIGDGDHGVNMARGMNAVMEALHSKAFSSAKEVYQTIAMQLISKVGGASGPLYGSAFMGFAKASDKPLPDLLQAGLDMIQKRGKATTSEKTMVDVWSPVIESMREKSLTPQTIEHAVEATKYMRATKGRASYLGERSIGHIDPGARSSGYLFEAMMEAGIK